MANASLSGRVCESPAKILPMQRIIECGSSPATRIPLSVGNAVASFVWQRDELKSDGGPRLETSWEVACLAIGGWDAHTQRALELAEACFASAAECIQAPRRIIQDSAHCNPGCNTNCKVLAIPSVRGFLFFFSTSLPSHGPCSLASLPYV